jgi:hypothetical protein
MKRLALALPVLLLAACGGSDLSKADYLSKAEAVCKDANTRIDGIAAPSTPASFESFIRSTIEIAEKATKDLNALDAPSDDKADLEKKFIDPLESQVSEGKEFLDKVKAAVATNDQAELGKLLQDPPISTQADLDWMRTYGFKECVESAETDG